MRQLTKSVWCFTLVAMALFAGGCAIHSRSAGKSPEPRFPEFAVKQRLQAQFRDPAPALVAERQLRNGSGADFVVPSALAYSDAGDLYVADNNAHAVHRWSAGSTRADVFLTQKTGALNFPYALQYADHKLYVSDNDGIKVFSADGQFEKLIRTYFGVFSFALTEKGTILVNALVRNADARSPLIVELDNNGKLIRGFGSRQNVKGHNGLEDEAFLAVSNGLLFVAFKYRPLVEVYDVASGRLNRTLDISHPVFQLLAKEMLDGGKAGGTKLPPRYLAGIKTVADRIFLCLYLPKPEIWEMNEDGLRVHQFQISSPAPALDIFGFDVRAMGSSVTISLGLIDPGLSPSVSEVKTDLS